MISRTERATQVKTSRLGKQVTVDPGHLTTGSAISTRLITAIMLNASPRFLTSWRPMIWAG